jgi:hypothetical protein
MADTRKEPGKSQSPSMIPGYGQPPDGVRTDHPGLPDQGWGAQPNPEERKGPDVPMPDQTPVEGP